MRLARCMLYFAAAHALAGCALLKDADTAGSSRPDVVEGMAESATGLEQLLRYFQRIRKLTGAELAREQNNARRTYTRQPSDFQRVQLAMALSPPNAAAGDQARALELLDAVARNPNSGLHGLAFLMSVYLRDQRRLENGALGLQQKLDDLKSMEKALLERERAGAKRQ